jgi:hypothetical protein
MCNPDRQKVRTSNGRKKDKNQLHILAHLVLPRQKADPSQNQKS